MYAYVYAVVYSFYSTIVCVRMCMNVCINACATVRLHMGIRICAYGHKRLYVYIDAYDYVYKWFSRSGLNLL